MNKEIEMLKKFEDVKNPIIELDNENIIAEDVNDSNNTVYIVEDKDGNRSVKLYNEVKGIHEINRNIIVERMNKKMKDIKESIANSKLDTNIDKSGI